MLRSIAMCFCCIALAVPTADAAGLTLPSPKEAKVAVLDMMEMQQLAKDTELKIGTCIPAIDAKHPGQVACTLLLKIGAGSSETQADFYRKNKRWVAQPSSSQEKLPFPDPALN